MCKDSEKFRQSHLELLAELTPRKTSPNLQPNSEKTAPNSDKRYPQSGEGKIQKRIIESRT